MPPKIFFKTEQKESISGREYFYPGSGRGSDAASAIEENLPSEKGGQGASSPEKEILQILLLMIYTTSIK